MIHYMLLAQMHQQYDDAAAALTSLRKAYDAAPNTDVMLMMTVTFTAAGDAAGARAFLDAAAQDEPANPIKAIHWRREINKLYDYVDSIKTEPSERG
jgi:thioredoxin-like negative regulator of GroEL